MSEVDLACLGMQTLSRENFFTNFDATMVARSCTTCTAGNEQTTIDYKRGLFVYWDMAVLKI